MIRTLQSTLNPCLRMRAFISKQVHALKPVVILIVSDGQLFSRFASKGRNIKLNFVDHATLVRT